jgi:hypothetical protein
MHVLVSAIGKWRHQTYLDPAPFPAPATPFPAAVTMAPPKLPTPDAAALVVRVSQLCCCGGFLAGAAAGRGFFASALTGFFAGALTGFFADETTGFFAGATTGFLYGTVLVWAGVVGFFAGWMALGPTGVFLVPMGCGAILGGFGWTVVGRREISEDLGNLERSVVQADISSSAALCPMGNLYWGCVALTDDVRITRFPNWIKVAVARNHQTLRPLRFDVVGRQTALALHRAPGHPIVITSTALRRLGAKARDALFACGACAAALFPFPCDVKADQHLRFAFFTGHTAP